MFYCRHEGENRQGHLEGSRLNQAMIGERERGGGERKPREQGRQEQSSQEPRQPRSEVADLYRKEKLRGKEVKPRP